MAEDTTIVKKQEEQIVEAPKLTETQKRFWETLEQYFEAEVVKEFGVEKLKRVYEFIEYCKFEREFPELPEGQEVYMEYFPGLRAQPWWEVDEIGNEEDPGDWVQKIKEGLPYVQGELADLLEDNEDYLISDSVKSTVMGGGWAGFRLQRLGVWMKQNCELFENTVKLIKQSDCPLAVRGIIVARQEPNTGVDPHSDGRNCFLTAHFGLSVPPECDITVGGETRPWKEDDCIILDTSFVHSTRNDSDEDRFVLIVDFWHPDLTVPEQEALEYIYDFRNRWEQGKIKYRMKLPPSSDILGTLYCYSAWGGAYSEWDYSQEMTGGSDTFGGFKMFD